MEILTYHLSCITLQQRNKKKKQPQRKITDKPHNELEMEVDFKARSAAKQFPCKIPWL